MGLGSMGLGSTGLGSTGLGSTGLGSTGLGSMGLGSKGLGSTGLGSMGLGRRRVSEFMLFLVLGGLILFVFWGGLRAFERASITTIKSLVTWIAALGGISLGLLLVLTGRWPLAIGALTFFGPTIWNHWRAANPRMRQGGGNTSQGSRGQGPSGPGSSGQSGGTAGQGAGGQGSSGQSGPARRSGAMSREEAFQVLGLHARRHRGGNPRGAPPLDAGSASRRRRVGLVGLAGQSGARCAVAVADRARQTPSLRVAGRDAGQWPYGGQAPPPPVIAPHL